MCNEMNQFCESLFTSFRSHFLRPYSLEILFMKPFLQIMFIDPRFDIWDLKETYFLDRAWSQLEDKNLFLCIFFINLLVYQNSII